MSNPRKPLFIAYVLGYSSNPTYTATVPTTRGFKEAEMIQIANMMCEVMENIEDGDVIAIVREKVSNLCARFPVYG